MVIADCLESVPGGGDVYLLARVLHGCDGNRALAISSNCCRAMPAHARLLVAEAVLREGRHDSFEGLADLFMPAMTVGRERTEPGLRAQVSAAYEP